MWRFFPFLAWGFADKMASLDNVGPKMRGQQDQQEMLVTDAASSNATDSKTRFRAVETAEVTALANSDDWVILAFHRMRLMASMQNMDNHNFWTCGQKCANENFPIMWFTPLHPRLPQRLLMKNGGWGVLASTEKWWQHVPGGFNMEWMDVWSCGAQGLKNHPLDKEKRPTYTKYEHFQSKLELTLSEALRNRLRCTKDWTKCPLRTRLKMCWLDENLEMIFDTATQMEPADTWNQHAELRAMVGKTMLAKEGDLEPNKKNEQKKNLWMDTQEWKGPSHWPENPFLAGLKNFESRKQDPPHHVGWRPSQEDYEALKQQKEQLQHTCCTLLMSAPNKTLCNFNERQAKFPLYAYWREENVPDTKEVDGIRDRSFLEKIPDILLQCSVQSCKPSVPPEGSEWLEELLWHCDERDRSAEREGWGEKQYEFLMNHGKYQKSREDYLTAWQDFKTVSMQAFSGRETFDEHKRPQVWAYYSTTGLVVNADSQLCLEADLSQANGGIIQQQECDPKSKKQQWDMKGYRDSFVMKLRDGACLDSPPDKDTVHTWECVDGEYNYQRWTRFDSGDFSRRDV